MRICYTGKQRAGKDTAAEFLIKTYGGTIYKFADPLYEMMHSIYEIAGLPHGSNTKDRTLLQFLGTDWGRKTIDPDIWINIMDKRLINQSSIYDTMKEYSIFNDYNEDNIFVTDARFPNEIELLKQHGFKICRIDATEENRISRGATNLTHASETALDNYTDYDYIIDNNEKIEKFYGKMEIIYNELLTNA
jgi:dephospho-CoA kinase